MASLNWPLIDEAVAFTSGPGSSWPPAYWVSMTARSKNTNKTTRGKSYELDTIQTGGYTAVWDNRDGALSPVNTASPYAGAVLPFRAYRKRAMWPVTQNILTGDQATSGQTSPIAAGGTVTQYLSNITTPVVQTSATAVEGTQVMQLPVAANPVANQALVYLVGFTMQPNTAHTFSIYVRTTSGASALTAVAGIIWYTAAGATISTTLGTPATLPTASTTWTRLTVTGAPPAGAAGALVGVQNTNSPTAGFTFQCDAAQLEYAPTATTWTAPGTWYPIFTGWVAKWPVVYGESGTLVDCTPDVVDSFGYLSQQLLKPAYYNAVLALGPDFFYPLDEGQGAPYAVDRSNNHLPAPLSVSPYGPGTCTFGNSIQSTTPMDVVNGVGAFVGGGSRVCTMVQTTSSVTTGQDRATYIDLLAAGIPGPPTTGAYTRIIAFRAPVPPPPTCNTTIAPLWIWSSATFAPPYHGYLGWGLGATNDSHPGEGWFFAGNGGAFNVTSNNLCDGNWHFLAVVISVTNATLHLYYDGIALGTATGLDPSFTWPANATGGDAIGAMVFTGGNGFYATYAGDVSCAAEFPVALTDTQLGDLYTAWRVAYRGESSSARYSRILGYTGYKGASNLTTGPGTSSMGPASDISAGSSSGGIYAPTVGIDVFTALQNVVTTENGTHFVDASGVLTFQSRAQRYFIGAPAVTFGENLAGGEVPYEDVGFDFDATRLGNDAQVTQYFNSAVFEKFNPASQAAYGTYTMSRTANTMNSLECNDAASYFCYRYGQPDLRVNKLRLHPSANPTTWPYALSLELGTRVRVNRRSLGQPSITWNGFVEALSWSFNHDTGDAYCDLELSPSDMLSFWETSAWHSTLAGGVSAGATSLVINPMADAATVPFSAYMPCQVSGTSNTVAIATYTQGPAASPITVPAPKIRVGAGGGTWEEVTVTGFTCSGGTQVTRVNGLGATVNVAGAFTGYTSVTLTFTPALVNNYAVNAGVSESLYTPNVTPYPSTPILLTNTPAVYDANSVLGTSTIIGY